MPARVAFSLDTLQSEIPKIFDQVQATSANHQKNLVALYKLQTEAAKITESVQNGKSIKLVGERAFEDMLLTCLSRAMPVKKGATVADRVIKFVGGFTKFINEKGALKFSNHASIILMSNSPRRATERRTRRRRRLHRIPLRRPSSQVPLPRFPSKRQDSPLQSSPMHSRNGRPPRRDRVRPCLPFTGSY